MINLLPPDQKTTMLYARRNTKLRNWCSVFLLAIVGVLIIMVFGQLYMDRTIKSYAAQVTSSSEQLKNQKLEETQKQVTDISSSLQLVLQVLSREILFSKLIQQIGTIIPPGAALSDLSINKVEGGIDLRFNAADYSTATQVHVNFQDPENKIFDKADLISITCAATGAPDPRYPCQVAIRAQFAKSNPFSFTGSQAKEVKP
jgi:hypothetical protein